MLFSGNISWSANKAINFVEYRDNWSTGAQEAITYSKSDLAFSPNLIARAEVNYDIIPTNKKHALGITLSGKHVGRQFLDNTSNAYAQLPAFRFMDARFNYNSPNTIISLVGKVNNLFNAKYASNGWVYRFTSPDYDPRSDDFYTRQEGSGGIYHQAGYFPQAGTNWMMTVVVEF